MRRILIVEDDFYIRDLYEKAFTKADAYTPTTTTRGDEAIKILEKQSFDIILLDIMLPDMSGIEILKNIQNNPLIKRIPPAFLITNLADDEKIKEGFSLGAEGYLIKAEHTPNQVVKEIDLFFKNKNLSA